MFRKLCNLGILPLFLFASNSALADPAADAYRRGYACLTSNRYSEAAAFFQTACATTNPVSAAAAWLARGEALYGLKQWDGASAAYGNLLKNYPASPHVVRALYARGCAEYQAGQLQQARATFSDFIARNPKHALAATAAASSDAITRTLAAQSKQRETEETARTFSAINAFARDGKFADAADAARRFLLAHPEHPQSAELRYLAANSALRAKDYSQAVTAYRDFLARHPKHAQASKAQLELGGALQALARYGEAADVYATASGAEAPLLCAENLFKAGRYEQALDRYQALAKRASDPDVATHAAIATGDCYAALKQWKTAESVYLNAAGRLSSDDAQRPHALAHLATLYESMGQTNQAARAREGLKRRYPNWR